MRARSICKRKSRRASNIIGRLSTATLLSAPLHNQQRQKSTTTTTTAAAVCARLESSDCERRRGQRAPRSRAADSQRRLASVSRLIVAHNRVLVSTIEHFFKRDDAARSSDKHEKHGFFSFRFLMDDELAVCDEQRRRPATTTNEQRRRR